jgi:hypothetical protein
VVAELITINHFDWHHPLSFQLIDWDWLWWSDHFVFFDRFQLSTLLFSFLIAVTPDTADRFSLDSQE